MRINRESTQSWMAVAVAIGLAASFCTAGAGLSESEQKSNATPKAGWAIAKADEQIGFVPSTRPAEANADEAIASIDDDLRFVPTTRPMQPEAQHPPLATTQNVDTGKPVHEWQRATDDWFGARPWLDDHGVTVGANLTIDASRDFRGGGASGDNFTRNLFNLNLTLNTERLIGWKGGTFFVNFQNEAGTNGSERVGSIQTISNIDSEGVTEISELWYEQTMFDGKLRAKVGKVDANTEFAVNEYGAEFLNGTAAVSPNILGIPAYPDPATSVNLFFYLNDTLYFGAGIYDGATQEGIATGSRGPATFFGSPSDLFLIGEGGAKWSLQDKSLAGRLGVGAWHHTGSFDRFDGGVEKGTSGFYLTLNQMLWRKNPTDQDDDRGIAMYAQYAHADRDVSEVEHHIGVGATWKGAIPSREDDVIGLGVSYANLSDDAAFTASNETLVEGFYKIQILKWLSIKPDIQYIHNPGGDSSATDAWVGSLRVQMEF